jgi:hypothetical protein
VKIKERLAKGVGVLLDRIALWKMFVKRKSHDVKARRADVHAIHQERSKTRPH